MSPSRPLPLSLLGLNAMSAMGALTLLLSACGGGSDASYTLGGSISGLSSSGLVLANGSQTLNVASGATSFVFGSSVSGSYEVKVSAQPVGQTCSVSQGSGSVSGDVSSVVVACRSYTAYVANTGSSSLAQFSVTPGSGQLAALASPSLTNNYPPTALALSADGRFAYSAHQDDKGVSTYSITSSGALTLLGQTNAVSESRGLAISPDGAHVYVANYTDKSISQFSVGSGGLLSAMSPATVASGSTPVALAITPSGSYAYALNLADHTISQYSVASSGALTALTTATVSVSGLGSSPMALAISPDSRYVYVTLSGSDKLAQYSIGSTGTLSALSPASVATGSTPRGIALNAAGSCAYVANRGSGTVSQYIVTGGTLTAQATPSVAAGANPTGVAVSPDGKYVYVSNAGAATLSQYSVDAACALTALGTVSSGGSTPGAITVR